MSRNITLRLCYTHIEDFLMFDEGVGRFTGIMAPLVHPLAESWNATLIPVREEVYGSLVDEEKRLFNGCIGSTQRNESDLGLVQVPAPLFGPNIMQGPPLGYEKMSILSGYDPRGEKFKIDVMSAVHSFPPILWLMVVGQFAFFFLMLLMLAGICVRIAGEMRSRKVDFQLFKWTLRCLCYVTAKGLKISSAYGFRRRASFIRLTTLSLTLFTFWIHCFIFSLIKTELTVVEPPLTIKTYDYVLDNNIQPSWLALLGDKDLFRYSPPNRIERKVWDKATKMTGNQIEKALISNASPNALPLIMSMIAQKAVLIVGRMMLGTIRNNFCAGLMSQSLLEEVYTWVAIDEASLEYVRVGVINRLYDPSSLRYVWRMTMKTVESGIMEEATKRTGLMFTAPGFKLMQKCLSDELITKAASFDPPNHTYYHPLFLISISLILSSATVLIIEILWRKYVDLRNK